MDTDTAGPYKKERYDEIAMEMKDMMIKTGWKKEFVEGQVPVIPISGWMGDNLLKKSANMTWYTGQNVVSADGNKVLSDHHLSNI